jgi:hypothetical protein
MRILAIMILTMTASGCAPEEAGLHQSDAICDATSGPRTQLAAALAADGGVQSVTSGRALIAILDAGCRTN